MINQNDNSIIIELARVFHQALKKHGVSGIIRKLKQVEIGTGNDNYDEKFNFIVKIVCEKVRISKEQLFNKAIRKETMLGKKICMLLFRKHLDLSDEKTATYFDRSRQVVHNVEKEFKNLSPKHKDDIEFKDTFSELNEKVEAFKKKLNSKKKDSKNNNSEKE